ncbi:unnamed protein product [Sphagnum tenellum]
MSQLQTSSNWFTSCSLQKQTSTNHFHVERIHAVMMERLSERMARSLLAPKNQMLTSQLKFSYDAGNCVMLGKKVMSAQTATTRGGRQNPELAAEVQYAQRSTSLKCKMLMLGQLEWLP